MTMEKTRSASSSSSSSSSFSRFSSSLCRRRAIPKSWSRLEKKSAVLFRTCIIAGMMVLLFANEREGRKSSIFPPMSAEATAVHPATQITHDDIEKEEDEERIRRLLSISRAFKMAPASVIIRLRDPYISGHARRRTQRSSREHVRARD